MKTTTQLPAILLACIYTLFFSTGCKKEESVKNVANRFVVTNNSKPAEVNGVSAILKKSTAKNYILVMAQLSNGDQAFVEIFYANIFEGVVVQIPGPTEDLAHFGYIDKINGTWYEASSLYKGASGTVYITKYDPDHRVIGGSFFGIAVNASDPMDKKNLDGSFTASY